MTKRIVLRCRKCGGFRHGTRHAYGSCSGLYDPHHVTGLPDWVKLDPESADAAMTDDEFVTHHFTIT